MKPSQKRKKKAGKCVTPYCRNMAAKGRTDCHKCKDRKYRAKHPIRRMYHSLKGHAKERGKHFDMTYEDFKSFVMGSGYMEFKGRKSDSYHIDRIDESKGYTIDNIQALTNKENNAKYREECPF